MFRDENTRMSWQRLIATNRIGSAMRRSTLDRPDFQRDGDKIAFCAPFRRLQGKLQVHAKTLDFARNRMTHSVECSRVGRTLGRHLGEILAETGELPEGVVPQDIADAVEAACLAHDIGTPPAAHLGEDVIRDFFQNTRTGSSLVSEIDANEASDFFLWEGNAQGFRFLTRETGENGGPGLGLTATTIAAVIKYPCTADLVDPQKGVHRKKFNVFRDDLPIFEEMAGEMGLIRLEDGGYVRHPLSFLVEAADDICYSIIDLEDAWRLGLLSDTQVLRLYGSVVAGGEIDASEKCNRADSAMERISCMRGLAISTLVHAVRKSLRANYEAIMRGRFDGELLGDEASIGTGIPAALKEIKVVSRSQVYASRDVCEDIQTITRALTCVLEALGSELLAFSRDKRKRPLLRMRYPRIFDASLTRYQRLLRLTDTIACMSEEGLLEEAAFLASGSGVSRAPEKTRRRRAA